MSLQNALLKANGGSWRNPPPRVHWSTEHQHERDAILALLHGCPCWGFKDPRTLFTLNGWIEALPQLKMIGIVRHPLAVAKSLQSREGWPLGVGMDLWARYNARLLHYAATYRFPVISFDQPPRQFVEKLGELVKQLGLDPPAEGFQFYTSHLRHHHDTDLNAVPDPIACLYLSIQQLTI